MWSCVHVYANAYECLLFACTPAGMYPFLAALEG